MSLYQGLLPTVPSILKVALELAKCLVLGFGPRSQGALGERERRVEIEYGHMVSGDQSANGEPRTGGVGMRALSLSGGNSRA